MFIIYTLSPKIQACLIHDYSWLWFVSLDGWLTRISGYFILDYQIFLILNYDQRKLLNKNRVQYCHWVYFTQDSLADFHSSVQAIWRSGLIWCFFWDSSKFMQYITAKLRHSSLFRFNYILMKLFSLLGLVLAKKL